MLASGLALAGKPADGYKQSGMDKYLQKDYSGAIADLDKHLAENPSDHLAILIRGISKSLLEPEDVAGACADFLLVKSGLQGTNVEGYCAGQPGW